MKVTTEKIKYLGIDFGSKFSYITFMTENEKEPQNYCSNTSESFRCDADGYPTALAYDPSEDEWKIALKTVLEDFVNEKYKGYIYSGFKNLGEWARSIENVDAHDAKKKTSQKASEMAKKYFEKLLYISAGDKDPDLEKIDANVYKYKNKEGNNPSVFLDMTPEKNYMPKICVGYPKLFACAPDAVREVISEAYKAVYDGVELGDNIILQPEPYLAALAYVHTNLGKVNKNKNILLIDLGGYTMDLMMFQVNDGGNITVNNTYKPESLAYREDDVINSLIYDLVNEKACRAAREMEKETSIEKAKRALFSSGKDVAIALHDDIFDSDPKNKINLCFSDQNGDGINLFKNVNKYIFDNNYLSNFDIIEGMLPSGCKNIDQVIFTGGASKIEPLVRYILNILKDANYLSEGFSHSVGTLYTSELKDEEFMKPLVNGGHVLFMHDAEGITQANAVAYGACLVAAHPELKYGADVTDKSDMSYKIAATAKFSNSCFDIFKDCIVGDEEAAACLAEDIKKNSENKKKG